MEYGGKMGIKFKPSEEFPDYFETECTLNVNDDRDLSVEEYCNQFGIVYKKIGSKEISSIDSLEKRIYKPEDMGLRLVKANSEKLEKLIGSQISNIDLCKEEYQHRFRDNVDFIFKSADKFLTTKIVVFAQKGLTREVLDEIQNSDSKDIEDDKLYIYFGNESYEPDQCMYFGFQDLGMKKIPIYTDEISYRILNKLGVIEE